MELMKPDFSKIPGGCDMSAYDVYLEGGQPKPSPLFPGSQVIKNVLTAQDCDAIIALFDSQTIQFPTSLPF
jgi:hypothetical protein